MYTSGALFDSAGGKRPKNKSAAIEKARRMTARIPASDTDLRYLKTIRNSSRAGAIGAVTKGNATVSKDDGYIFRAEALGE